MSHIGLQFRFWRYPKDSGRYPKQCRLYPKNKKDTHIGETAPIKKVSNWITLFGKERENGKTRIRLDRKGDTHDVPHYG